MILWKSSTTETLSKCYIQNSGGKTIVEKRRTLKRFLDHYGIYRLGIGRTGSDCAIAAGFHVFVIGCILFRKKLEKLHT